MIQTPYVNLTTLSKNLPYNGGLCVFYYTLWENIQTWPTVNPLTQELTAEPVLKTGTSWYGPVKVPNSTLGFSEQPKTASAGIFYEIKVEADHIGDARNNRVNLQNMPYYKYVIVGKLRSGGMFILVGNPNAGLTFTANFNSGVGQMQTAKSEISFSQRSRFKAMVLPSFAGTNSQPAPGGESSTVIVSDAEEIPFNETGDTEIIWTTDLQTRFGNYPTIEIWAFDESSNVYYRANFSIEYDTTVSPKKFVIKNAGGTGFIKIT